MASLRVTGDKRLVRKLRRLGDAGRTAEPAVEEAAETVKTVAQRRGFGFRDRTGRLRRSVRVTTTETRTGAEAVVGTNVPYAAPVEARQRRRGKPPYWLGPAITKARRKLLDAMGDGAGRGMRKAVR